MNRYLYYGSAEAIPLYNCSHYTPIRPNPDINLYGGTFDVVYGFLVIFLYAPTTYVFYGQSRLACFKIMFFLAIVDMGAILINSVVTGFLLMHGFSYCDAPDFIYICGSIGLGCWCSACLTCLILALNRILDMVCPLMVKIYFRGYRTCAVLALPVIYGLFFIFCTPPIIFSAAHQTWFFDPNIMEGMNREYTNIPHTINNFSLVFLTCFLYVFFCYKVRSQLRKTFRPKRSVRQRQIFLQSTLLCLVHLLASVIYVIMQFTQVPKWVTILSQYLWQLAQGCPVIIYLLFNRKVRAAFLVLITSTSQDKSSNYVRKADHKNEMRMNLSPSSRCLPVIASTTM